MHRVAVLAQDDVVGIELATAVQVFEIANFKRGAPAYRVGVVGSREWAPSAALTGPPSFSVRAEHDWSWADCADTVVVPATGGSLDPPPARVRDLLLAAHERGARVASLCVGAFTVAATGLMDGRPATTHWHFADEFARRFPAVRLETDRLFTGQDGVYSAAGVTAALDLCLHLVELDLGAGVAAATARYLVAPMRREGGQSQFIDYRPPARPDELAATLRWAEEHLAEDLTLADLARHAAMSPRTFSRRFAAGVGTTPVHWLLRTRVRRAKELLEVTDLPVDRIAREVGFRSPSTFRHHFGRFTRTTPREYRRSFSGGRG